MVKIQTDDVYLLQTFQTTPSGESQQVELYNLLASQFNAVKEEDSDETLWGYVNWYDSANKQQHVIEVQSIPILKDRNIEVVGEDHTLYKFIYVTLTVYNASVRESLPKRPHFDDDASVQAFLKKV